MLNFRTSLIVLNEIGQRKRENRKRVIARHYLRGWFIIDIIAILPYSYIELAYQAEAEASGSANQLFKALRLIRLAKLLRLTKMLPLLRRLDDKFDGLLSSAKLLSVMFVVVYITHVVGCAWYVVGSSDEDCGLNPDNSTCTVSGWVSGFEDDWGADADVRTRWLRSFYWAMTTLTTVGYGDVSPTTSTEMIFGVLAELIGTIVFGTLVGTVGSIIGQRGKLAERHDAEIAEVKEFMQAKNLPAHLQKKVRNYLDLLFKQERAFDEKTVMDRMPPKLSFEMMDFLYGERLKKVPVFKKLPEEVIYELCQLLLPFPAEAGEFIYSTGDAAREIFVIDRGEVVVTSATASSIVVNEQVSEAEICAADPQARVYQHGTVFGEEALDFEDLVELRREKNAIAVKDVAMSMLRTSKLENLAKRFPILEQQVKLFQEERRQHAAHREAGQQPGPAQPVGAAQLGGFKPSSSAPPLASHGSSLLPGIPAVLQSPLSLPPVASPASPSRSDTLKERLHREMDADDNWHGSAGGPVLERHLQVLADHLQQHSDRLTCACKPGGDWALLSVSDERLRMVRTGRRWCSGWTRWKRGSRRCTKPRREHG